MVGDLAGCAQTGAYHENTRAVAVRTAASVTTEVARSCR